MKCIETQHTIAALIAMGQSLNPRNIAGIAVTGNTIHLQTLALPSNVTEKMSTLIPAMAISSDAPVTAIKSIQMKRSLLVVEVVGEITDTVRTVVRIIAAQLSAKQMVTGFFPCGTAKLPTTYYFGFSPEQLREASPLAKNLRLLRDGEGLVFTEENKMYRLPLSQLNNDWVRSASLIQTMRKNIAFLGRVQCDDTIAITLADETTFLAKLTSSQATVSDLAIFRQKISAVFGHMQEQAGAAFFAGLRGQELILIPAHK